MRVVVAVTGASGVQYALRLLRHLEGEATLILSRDAEKVIAVETDLAVTHFTTLARVTYADDDFQSPVASGSAQFDALVVIPCSMNTLAKIAMGLADTLITRAASVALKEKRRLIVVPRETPLHRLQLEHLVTLSSLGATILPAMPGFYHRPQRVEDLLDFIVARVLDHLEIPHSLVPRWGEGEKPFTNPSK